MPSDLTIFVFPKAGKFIDDQHGGAYFSGEMSPDEFSHSISSLSEKFGVSPSFHWHKVKLRELVLSEKIMAVITLKEEQQKYLPAFKSTFDLREL